VRWISSKTKGESRARSREVNGYYGHLFDRPEALDEAIPQAEIANEGDRFIIAIGRMLIGHRLTPGRW
jgi:hypothetical protein